MARRIPFVEDDPLRLDVLAGLPFAEPVSEDAAQSPADLWRARGLEGCPRAFATPSSDAAQTATPRRWFEFVDDPREAELLILVDRDRISELVAVRRHGTVHLLPTIDFTGAGACGLDVAFHPDDAESWTAVAHAIQAFASRARKLAPAARFSREPGVRLMVQLFVSGRMLDVMQEPGDGRLLERSGADGVEAQTAVAEELVARGLLSKTIMGRSHACVACGSRRQCAREHCVEAREVYGYALTTRAERLVALPDRSTPLPGPRAARDLATKLSREGRNAVVAELRFAAAEGVIATEGWTAFETLRRLFFENLERLLGDSVQVLPGCDRDFLMLLDVTAEEVVASERAIMGSCETTLDRPLGARVSILRAA